MKIKLRTEYQQRVSLDGASQTIGRKLTFLFLKIINLKSNKTNYRLVIFTAVILFSANKINAQTGVRIAGTSGTADPAAMLDIVSNSKGLLIPRMTEVERTAITTFSNGMLVYQTNNSNGFYFYDAGVPGWVKLSSGALGGSGTVNTLAKWTGTGTTLTSSTVQDNGTNVGIGTAPTGNKLEIAGATNISGNLTASGASNLNGGLFTQGTASTLYGTTAQIMANTGNVGGGGIMVSDDGGFFDYNNGPVTFNGSTGLVIAGNSGSASSNNYLRVNQLAGTGNRDVYVDGNGQLKASEKVATVVDRTERTQDNANSGFRTVGNATNALTVESGDVIVVSVDFQFKWNGGSGTDQPKFGIFGTGGGACGNISQTDAQEWQNADNVAREYFPIHKTYVFTAGCAGTYAFQLYVDNNSNADDASNTADIVITATKY